MTLMTLKSQLPQLSPLALRVSAPVCENTSFLKSPLFYVALRKIKSCHLDHDVCETGWLDLILGWVKAL